MSALLTTTMTYMKTVIDGFEAAGLGTSRCGWGAPISQMFADEIGADGYGANASAAVDLFLRLAASRKQDGDLQNSVLAEIPAQIKAEDDADDVTVELPAKFMERIDRLAAQRGLQASDDYLAQWQWSEEEERAGSAREVAEAVRAELEAQATW